MTAIQLDLFSWDKIKISEGVEQLSRLDFAKARAAFKYVLSKIPDHQKAIKGIKILEDWEEIIQRSGCLSKEESLRFLWNSLKQYNFPKQFGSEPLKKAILNRLILLIGDDNSFYIPPDLCQGYLFLLTGKYAKAEDALRTLLLKYPDNSRLIGYMGDSLWCQGRKDEAREIYAHALLLSPSSLSLTYIKDEELKEVIEEDIEISPINGWLKGILPLINIEDNPSIEKSSYKCLNIYRLLYNAEKARFSNNYDEMVSYRMMIKSESPDIFNMYMRRISV